VGRYLGEQELEQVAPGRITQQMELVNYQAADGAQLTLYHQPGQRECSISDLRTNI